MRKLMESNIEENIEYALTDISQKLGSLFFLKKGFGAITGHINIGFQLNLKTSPDFVTLKEL
jgi:hypothetical protein